MRLSLTVVDPFGGSSADVVLDAEPENLVGDVVLELAQRAGAVGGGQVIPMQRHAAGRAGHGGAPLAYVDGSPLDPGWTVAASPLRDGAVVSLHDPTGSLPGEPTGLAELRIAGGPGAGAVHRLGLGRYDVGRGSACHLQVEDPELDERALSLAILADGTCRVSVYGGAPARIDGELVDTPADAPWPRRLTARRRQHPAGGRPVRAAERRAGLGRGRRRPGLQPAAAAAPAGADHPVPAALAAEGARAAAAALADGAVAAGHVGDDGARLPPLVLPDHGDAQPGHDVRQLLHRTRSSGRTSHAKQVKEYKEHKARIETDAREALVLERLDRRHALPDPGTVLSTGTGPRTRLWERRRARRRPPAAAASAPAGCRPRSCSTTRSRTSTAAR